MKKYLAIVTLLLLSLGVVSCGLTPPTRQDALDQLAKESAPSDAQVQADAIVKAAEINAEAIVKAAEINAEAIKEAARIQAEAAGGGAGAAMSGAAVKAVDLIGAWVEAGAPETGSFDYQGVDGNTYQTDFETGILPLFTTDGVWFDGQQACSGCHFANSENSYHEMDLSTYAGIITGGDALSEPPGVPILGQSEVGASDFNWSASKLRARLRNNRMPPGWEFDITETNRDGPCVTVSNSGVEVQKYEYGCDLNAVGLIGAWVEAGAPETAPFSYGDATQLTFERDILPFFTEKGMWFENSRACGECHFANSENSYHEMDLTSYQGIMTGGDALSEPPGVPILGQSEVGATDFNWGASKLRARLRNNRMAPGVEFDITEENRDGPLVVPGQY
ncbi:MAG: hypothetical protein D6796_16940 [Caldilineae bacterium]|nr:MAG: hypothetical protein D6796_16940 [Caldilineae bacterium]